MDELSFSALAPRHGMKPMLSSWSSIGTSQMSGGAINWGNLWSGLKSWGSNVKHWGQKAWNSNTGQALRNKLKDTKLQEKVVDAVSSGIHGIVDIAQQKIDKEIQQRLEQQPPPSQAQIEEIVSEIDEPPVKRPREENEGIMTTDEPPRYEDIFPDKPEALVPTPYPMTRPITPMARPVKPPKPSVSSKVEPAVRYNRHHGWQGALNSIVGMGVKGIKRRRCF